MELFEGDKVVIREDLRSGMDLPFGVAPEMEYYRGRVAQVRLKYGPRGELGYNLDIDDCQWRWHERMFSHKVSLPLREGDRVKVREDIHEEPLHGAMVGNVSAEDARGLIVDEMANFAGRIVTIGRVVHVQTEQGCYKIEEDDQDWNWFKRCFEMHREVPEVNVPKFGGGQVGVFFHTLSGYMRNGDLYGALFSCKNILQGVALPDNDAEKIICDIDEWMRQHHDHGMLIDRDLYEMQAKILLGAALYILSCAAPVGCKLDKDEDGEYYFSQQVDPVTDAEGVQ